MHGLTTKKFAQRRAQHGTAIGEPRIRRGPCALELQFLPLAARRDELTQRDRSTITELPRPVAELMAPVASRVRAHAGRERVAGENIDRGPGRSGPCEPEFRAKLVGPCEQTRRRYRCRHHQCIGRISHRTRPVAAISITRQRRDHAGLELDLRKIHIH